ncbi:AAA domain-containing protein [Chloropicon primus]|uniref:AAA+ ATPase domain-containing protein n=1 Tax=Chloropicon primus TaxID=1764295 RepID=A0A5B8MHF9_9CHLO|nr:hypothetical protein A3770_02p16030 [Chloropicon primus]UPQ98294.1 AAA domain-containing protein [Chloropicon primus]|mmetsp:Transcript_591/g.1698  ORF Transcript_591/g.1698 Transcript_591/m.1698 type:complete len:504 (+) Transcript_591:176-1687(+)|eukprot:QDZ19085.1 hypothetical protein A3770_02p16030 [Chloropicon primus]
MVVKAKSFVGVKGVCGAARNLACRREAARAGFVARLGSKSATRRRRTEWRCEAICGDDDEGCIPEQDGSVFVRDDLDTILQVLPSDLRDPLATHPERANLLEIVMDLGRRPSARFLGVERDEVLREEPITSEDLEAAMDKVGAFGGDNRAGIAGTLHRISAIRNRTGGVVGLTCRVGRAVTGHVEMIRDLLEAEKPCSMLLLGRPGVGKTTVVREIARVLADELNKRVVIVDTSNEIGGDGDIPHPAIGNARRMQVPDPSKQHHIMVEAVENHMPQVVIIDEIGTEAEALACRTIAERGVMLVGTAHGQVIENLMKNPTLADLIGGIGTVTLSDEEARSRGTQKSVQERKGPATFPLLIEMRERTEWITHCVQESVDALLQGAQPFVEMRTRDKDSLIIENRLYDSIKGEVDEEQGRLTTKGSGSGRRRPKANGSRSPSLDWIVDDEVQTSQSGGTKKNMAGDWASEKEALQALSVSIRQNNGKRPQTRQKYNMTNNGRSNRS